MPEPTTFQAIGWVLLAIAALCVVANQVDDFFKRRQPQPSPSELQQKADEKYAQISDLRRVETDLSQEIKEVDMKVDQLQESIVRNGEIRRQSIEGKVESLRREVKHDTDAVHEKVNACGREVSKLEGTLNITNQNIANLTSQIQHLADNTRAARPIVDL